MAPRPWRTMLTICGITLLVGIVSLTGCRSAREAGSAADDASAYGASVPSGVTDPGTVDEFWQNALEEVYKSPVELTAQHQTELACNWHFAKLMYGDRSQPQIAITFDDGPHPQFTPKLLSILNAFNAKATFFVVGEKAQQAPDLVRQEIAAGHNVGNHTYHHVNLSKIPSRLVATEITACGDVLNSITGKQSHLFRPPGGDYTCTVAQTANRLDYTLILWTDDPGDYASPGAKTIEERTLGKVRNGGILLLHDGVQQTIDVLPSMLRTLQRRGFKFVTVDQMLAGKHS